MSQITILSWKIVFNDLLNNLAIKKKKNGEKKPTNFFKKEEKEVFHWSHKTGMPRS